MNSKVEDMVIQLLGALPHHVRAVPQPVLWQIAEAVLANQISFQQGVKKLQS